MSIRQYLIHCITIRIDRGDKSRYINTKEENYDDTISRSHGECTVAKQSVIE